MKVKNKHKRFLSSYSEMKEVSVFLVQYHVCTGSQVKVASDICKYYNLEHVDVVNVIYSVSYDDVFHIEPKHHAIICYRDNRPKKSAS